MRIVATTLILVIGALAGCIDSTGGDAADEGDDTTASGGNETAAPPSGGNNTTTAAPNTPPTANVTASPENGSAPLNVTFELTGEDGDGDSLAWTLDLGDGNQTNGTELPATVEHTYNASGNYTATLDVSDGSTSTTDSANVTVEAAEASAEPREDEWAVFNPDGTCDAKGAVSAGPYWWHDRPAEGDPPGTGYLFGGGTWVYEESNGLEGLQLGGSAESDAYQDCVNPDHLIF